MAFDPKIPCLVLKSLNGHETSCQAMALDENFCTPVVFDRDFENRSPEADFGLPNLKNSTFHFFAQIVAQTFFPSGSVKITKKIKKNRNDPEQNPNTFWKNHPKS